MISNREKQHIISFEKLDPENIVVSVAPSLNKVCYFPLD